MPLWLSMLFFMLCIILSVFTLIKWKKNKKVIFLIAGIWLIIASIVVLCYGLASIILIGGID